MRDAVLEFWGPLEKYENNLWNYHIKAPSEVVRHLEELHIKRFKCKLNHGKEFHAALMPAGEGIFFIKINKELRTIHKIEIGDRIHVRIKRDESQYGMPLPIEMEQLLLQDPEGDFYFQKLTPGKQRSLLYLVGKIKNPDKRIAKSIVIIEHLKERKGSLDFRILHHNFKDQKGLI